VTRGIVVIETNLSYEGASATGTGMVISPSGVVLTNNHVIRGATAIRVVDPHSGHRYTADVVGYAIGDDVAVLKLSTASGLATVRLGNSAGLRRGQAVTAVGNAGGTGALVPASGSITSLARTITVQDDQGGTMRLRRLIEINANLQPGDSGGPLLDGSGRVVGIDTAASSGYAFRTAGNDGYAIPINRALTLARQIQAGHASAAVHVGPTAFLGISAQSAGSSSAGASAGVLVGRVASGGPADRAGLGAGDVITAVGGRTISSAGSLVSLLQRKKPGDTIRLTWLDPYGNTTTAAARLTSGPPQ
jgi:S1-C subfamily serine protease